MSDSMIFLVFSNFNFPYSLSPVQHLIAVSQWKSQEYKAEMHIFQSACKTSTWETKVCNYGDQKWN